MSAHRGLQFFVKTLCVPEESPDLGYLDLGYRPTRRTDADWLTVGDRLKPEAAWPMDELPTEGMAFSGEGIPEIDATMALPVQHGGELLGKDTNGGNV